jgi:hypothetical protein
MIGSNHSCFKEGDNPKFYELWVLFCKTLREGFSKEGFHHIKSCCVFLPPS